MFRIYRDLAIVLAASAACAAAAAAPVSYTFSTAGAVAPQGPAALLSLLGAGASVSGSFEYNSSAAFRGDSGALGFEPGYAVYGGTSAETAALLKVAGEVAGLRFSDAGGSVSVGNDNAALGGIDVLSLTSDPSPKAGQNTLPTDYERQLKGFTIGDYTLSNVRLYWLETPGFVPDFLSSNALPGTLPVFNGYVSLDFIRASDPTNTAGVPYYSNSVRFYGLQVQATSVPEPTSLAYLMVGMLTTGCMAARRRAR